MLQCRKIKGSQNWYIRGTVAGHRVYESTGTSDRRHAEEYGRILQERLYAELVLGQKPDATFAEAVNVYLDAGRSGRFLAPLVRAIGAVALSEITQQTVDGLALRLFPTAQPATRVRQVYGPVSAVIRYAAEVGLPGAVWRPLKKPKVQRKPVQWATDDYLDKLLAHCDAHLRAVILIMTYTGLRSGEVLRTTPQDYLMRPGWVFVGRMKNGEAAFAPLPPEAAAAAAAVGYRWKWRDASALARAIRRAAERAGLDYRRAHVLGRHAFAARLLQAGHDIKLVKEAGRWKSLAVVDQNYGHMEQRFVHEAMLKVARKA
jgi:integrase